MNSEHVHRCWKTANELLQSLESGDLNLIESRLQRLRQALAVRPCLTDKAFAGDGFVGLEELDLLDGITASVETSVKAIRHATQPHLLRMQTVESLLRHLVEDRRAG